MNFINQQFGSGDPADDQHGDGGHYKKQMQAQSAKNTPPPADNLPLEEGDDWSGGKIRFARSDER